jgi:hypothetical protein
MLRRQPKVTYVDAVASRFALWIINRRPPPSAQEITELEDERQRHLLKLMIELGIYASIGGALLLFARQWAVYVMALLMVVLLPKLWALRRDYVATGVLFQPAGEVGGLLREVEQARERSPAVEEYCRAVTEQERPLMRVEALALVAVPSLNEKDWLDPQS